MKRIFLGIIIAVFIIFTPNIIWFKNSTAYISNNGPNTLSLLSIQVGDKTIHLGKLMPGENIFMLLPKTGNATFRVRFMKNGRLTTSCEGHTQNDMVHIEAKFSDAKEPECAFISPFFSKLFIIKLLKEVL